MSQIRQTPVQIGGKNGIIMHDLLCADGPVDPVTKEPLIDPETGKPYPGKNDDMADLLKQYLVVLNGSTYVGGESVARYGVLSLLAMNTTVFIYDHPRLKQITNTAFTDGIGIFLDADFFRKLREQEEDSDGNKHGIIPLLLHELMHKLKLHTTRMRGFDPRIANIAQDLVINAQLMKGFGDQLPPVPLLQETGHGFDEQSAEKYYKMSEEVVAEQLTIEDRKKKQKEEEKKKQKGNGSSSGDGSGGGGQSSSSGESEEQESEDQKNNGKKGQNKQEENGKKKGNNKSSGQGEEESEENGGGDIHHITPEELIEILKEEGLENVLDALDYPQDADDLDAVGKIKEKNVMNITDAVQTAMSEASKLGEGGKYPGQHIAESAADIINGLQKGKLQWKLGIKKHIHGDGQKLYKSDDEAALPWYLGKEVMGVDPWYEGALIPQAPDETVVCLVDSSGSTGGGDMRKQFMQECLTLKKGVSSMGDTARKVVILSADTVLRGEPIEVTERTVDELMKNGVPIFGNGGTSFESCLKQALDLPLLKKEKVKSVIYFTDCEDYLPARSSFQEYLDKGIRIVFVTTPSCWNDDWNKKLTWAEVYCIEDGTTVDLEKSNEQITTNTRKNRVK